MGIKQSLKNHPDFYKMILYVLNAVNYFNLRFWYLFPSYQLTDHWQKRIELAKQSSDNKKINYVANAGEINKDHQVMHNGLKIALGSYYDYGNTILIRENKGIHEPQEEYVFQEALKNIPNNACIMELGSYWAFYSMWFAFVVPYAKCIMIEPDPHKMNFGQLNFKMNNLSGIFDLGFVDQHPDLKKNIPVYSVDYLVSKYEIDFIHVLHSDIQGCEFKMLQGAAETIKNNKIGYIFISTHSNELHNRCEAFMRERDYDIVCSANLDETFSWDGLLVAKHKNFPGLNSIEISKRK